MHKLISHLILPTEVTRFERAYLERMTKVGLWFFYAHLPVMVIVALLARTSVVRAALYTAVVLVGPTLAMRTFENPRHITRAFAFTAMVLGGLLVHFGQGPMQIEMHFYFFVLIALLAVFGDPLVIILAAVTVAAHHLILWVFATSSVFNYDASIWAVVIHALFVVVESVAACFVARSFFDNVIELERIVARRTDELAARNEQMKVVLGNVEQGLVVVHSDGVLGGEQSTRLATLIAPANEGDRIWDWIGAADASVGAWLEVGWSMLVEGVFPLEVALEQLPKRLLHAGRVLQLSYTPLSTDASAGAFAGLLFVVTDVTSEAERERYEAEQREMLVLFERVLKDPRGVVEFAAEGSEMVEAITEENLSLRVTKRLLHTLKGNAGILGCGTLARVCHEIESRVEESGGLLASDSVELRVSWDHVQAKLARLVGDRNDGAYLVDPKEHAAVVRALREGQNRSRVVDMLHEWTLEPTEIRLKRLADQARRLGARLGRGEVDVRIESNGVRLTPERLRPFWASLLHLLRNAVDHGLEDRAERLAAGKSPQGTIDLSTRLTPESFVVELRDDGRGVDWERVREKALEKGVPAVTHDDLVAALFVDGFSTRAGATELSGRGVGMSAVLGETRMLGGAIQVDSSPGRGTKVTIRLPRGAVAPRSDIDPRKASGALAAVSA